MKCVDFIINFPSDANKHFKIMCLIFILGCVLNISDEQKTNKYSTIKLSTFPLLYTVKAPGRARTLNGNRTKGTEEKEGGGGNTTNRVEG